MDYPDEKAPELTGFPPINFSIRHFSLMNSLFTVLNQTKPDDPDSIIARYFLDHFEHLSDLNVYDVAEACYTSRSGIRRFCQSIGYENFSAIKESSYEWQRHREFFVDYADHDAYHDSLSAQIAAMTREINQLAPDNDLDRLAELIHRANEIVLVTSDFSSMAALEFQQSMLFMRKLVRILTDSFGDESLFRALGPHDLVIVISATGNFARVANPALRRLPAHRVLITLNHDTELASAYDEIHYLSRMNYELKRTVFARYGVNYFFDLLYHRYFLRYGKVPDHAS